MAKKKSVNIINMITWLRKKLEVEDGYNVYDLYKEEPGLPIHLYCTKDDGKKIIESLVVIVTSATKITSTYFNKLCFLQSYLSLYDYMGPVELKLILAIPDNGKIIKEPLSSKRGQKKFINQESYEEMGFGLLKITAPYEKEPAKFEYSCKPFTLRDRMEKDFKNKFPKAEKETKKITRFFTGYIDDTVVGIAGEHPVKFEERNIDRKLLEHINNLENVIYNKELQQIANDYLSYEKDDYSFAMEWIKTLWNNYFQIEYPNIHEKLEPMLKELYPKYRDHFLHQFQVFMIGSIMIDYLISFNRKKCDRNALCKGWLLASTFHDFAQAVQKYDQWNKTFFKESLKIDVLESLELKKYYVENTFSSSVEHILTFLGKCFCDFKDQDRTENYNKIRHFFYHQITDKKNHGMLSSLSLLKRFDDANDEFHEVILPAASAIAIHDAEIWKVMSGMLINSNKDKWITNLCTIKPLSRLNLNLHPLSFLLILSDNIQDWGRHFKDLHLEESSKSAGIGFKSINLDGDKISIQLFVNVNKRSLNYITYLIEELNLIKDFLQSSFPYFVIEFWDREKNERTTFSFEIRD